jgi:hypothetical protein
MTKDGLEISANIGSKDVAEPTLAASTSVILYWNAPIACGWLLVACLGLSLFALSDRPIQNLLGVGLTVYSLQAAVVFLPGVVLRRDSVAIPRSLATWAPLVIVGRKRIYLSELTRITVMAPFMKFKHIMFVSLDGRWSALFASRNQRRMFLDAVRERTPDIKIYRAARS